MFTKISELEEIKINKLSHSTMDELDSLTDNELRLRLMQYGKVGKLLIN